MTVTSSYRLPERRNIFLEKYNTAYFFIPKVASTSIKALCTRLLGLQVEKHFHKVNFPSLPRSELLANPDIFKFAFVRNPFDRLVSCYASKVRNCRDFARNEKWHNLSFDQFVQRVCEIPNEQMDVHFRPQYTFITDDKGTLVVDFLGRIDRFDDDMKTIFSKTGFPDSLRVDHRGRSIREHYQKYYTKKSRKLVAERFAEDLQLFEYSY